jgi:hypothetical protein
MRGTDEPPKGTQALQGGEEVREGLDWRYGTALKTLETTSTWMMSGDGCDR